MTRCKLFIPALCLVAALVATLTLAGCSGGSIGKDEAMTIAVSDLGQQQINVSSLTAKLEKSGDQSIYRVDFIYATQSYEYVIDAKSKAILSKKVKTDQQ
jgi:uncharacterized membrane protein YkoI